MMDNGARYYRIAFSTLGLTGKLRPGDPLWGKLNGSFENLELSPPAIAWLIDEGRAFTTWHKDNWRTSANYLCGQHIGVDFDTRGVESVLADPFVQAYAAIVYATPSSTPDNPRCRALFLLDTPIMQAANYVRAATALLRLFGSVADQACKDAARSWWGSLDSLPTRLDNELPLVVVRQLIATFDATHKPAPRREYTPRGEDGKAIAGTLQFAAQAQEGQRNASLYWAACRWQERGVARDDAETMGMAAGRSSGLGETEVLATVRSAYRGG